MNRKLLAAGVVFLLHGQLGLTRGQSPPPAQPYVWRAVAMGGGGFVDGIVFHPTAKDVIYARTDVGGAYRWDAGTHAWIALNDWLSAAQGNLTGIESIALDPSDPSRLYLAAGTYTSGPAAILRSGDQGRTFQYTQTPFRMGGNADGRSNGERLAVDPNDGTVLYFGSRRDGLWRSADRGATWTRVESFPQAPDQATASTLGAAAGRRGGFRGNQSIGIVSVVFDPASGRRGSPTPVIYAAVSTSGTNLFRSDDAGAHWQSVAGQPVGPRPSHLIRSADGLFYLTYGSAAGPNNVRDGALWKYNSTTGAWTDITPEKSSGRPIDWGYGAVSVDARHPSTIVASTIDRWALHDEVFRSTDGGLTWRGILTNGRMDYSMAPYTRRMTPHWLGALAINPNNPDQVLFGTGYGLWSSTDATKADSGGRVDWVFLDTGLEETVPLALISPPAGAHLISGVGDIDGFRHDDVDVSPPEGTFAGTKFSTTHDLAFAAAKPNIMIRLGNGGRSQVNAAISDDGGTNWTAFGSDAPGGNGGQGSLAISSDGATIVWSVQPGSAFVTSDRGRTWTNSRGFSGRSIVADPVNPARFYAMDTQSRKLLVSADRAATFAPAAGSMPNLQDFGRGGVVLTVTTGMAGDIWAGSRDSGLYHSTDGGASFSKLDNVTGADALGFGKAAPGQSFPALYLLGRINGLHARYRSDDTGRTWSRIDDDQHQFATANVPLIIGDPRIYGRVYVTTSGRGVIYGDLTSKPK
jgi:photosystem II stability/assembly factor-like uncharacterized protein